MTPPLRVLLDELEHDPSLYDPHRFPLRVEALDRLEVYLDSGRSTDEVIHLSARLEAANAELYRAIRSQIQRGAGRDAFLPWLHTCPAQGQAYDFLDELLLGIFEFEDFAAEPVPLAPEMVSYQPTPARHIFDLIDRTALTAHDVLIDLGSGLGHVPLLASICTPARCIGIERDPAYVASARHSAHALNLNHVTFQQQDVRDADFSAGTVFYLYTPFTGTILSAVLDSLRQEASRRPLRICTFGPCTPIVAEEPWLKAAEPPRTDRIAVFSPAISPSVVK